MGIPAVVRTMFSVFPLKKLPAEQSDLGPQTQKGSSPILYVYCIQENDSGFSCYEPRCLASEIFLKLNGDDVIIKEVSSLGTSNNMLPLLVQYSPSTVGDKPKKGLYTTFQAILNRWETSSWMTKEVRVYRKFVETALHDAYILTLLEAADEFSMAESTSSKDNLTSKLYLTSEEQRTLPHVTKSIFSREIHGVLLRELGARYANIEPSSSFWTVTSPLGNLKQYRSDIMTRATECVESMSALVESSTGFISIGPRIGSSPLGAIDVIVYCYVNVTSLVPESEYSAIVKPLRPHHSKVHKYLQSL